MIGLNFGKCQPWISKQHTTSRARNVLWCNRKAERLVVLAGKKKKGSGGSKKKPKSSSLSNLRPKPYLSTSVIMQNLLLVESYYRKTGRTLFEEEVEISDVAEILWNSPFAVLAHDNSDPEPCFVYGNQVALDLFETEWDELIGTPSSKSAEPNTEIQEDRSHALSKALENGYIDNYEGWRQSFKGTRFMIRHATVFNVEAPNGDQVGQAAIIRGWEYEDGTLGGALATSQDDQDREGNSSQRNDIDFQKEIEDAEKAVAEQASAVRAMKEVEGLANSDEKVQAAVAELLARKEKLESLRK